MRSMERHPPETPTEAYAREVADRFGGLPHFFCSAQVAPGLGEGLWGFARSAYLDNPLPSAFKERLFVHLSRFCASRFCLVRHASFLMGHGRPAGVDGPVAGVDEVIALLERPIPDAAALAGALQRLERGPALDELPLPGQPAEHDLLDALSAVFVDARRSTRAAAALRGALGERRFELAMALLAFVRTAHFWTETHPGLPFEADMLEAMRRHPRLERLLAGGEGGVVPATGTARDAFDELRDSLREGEARQDCLLRLSDALRPLSDPGQVQACAARILGQHLGANRCQYCEALADEDTLLWGAGHADGVDVLQGLIRISDFDPAILDLFRRGRTLVVDDFAEQDRSPEQVAAFDGASIRAAVAVPLVKAGRLVAVLSLHHATPRHWTPAQVGLAEEVAERTWAAVERARAEEALRQSEASLQESDRRKDEFLATLAHELRNPLAPIRNALHLLRVAPDRISADRVHGMLDRQVRHMVRLLDELLEVSRISRGVIDLQRRHLDLRTVVSDAVEASRAAIEQRRHRLEVHLPDEPVVVDGDGMRLAQVLSNLLNNAARYTDAGGRIDLALRQDGRYACIEVRDTGIGIAPDKLASVFAMFGQLDRRDPRSQGGLGVGLALAQSLAHMHGGGIEAASEGAGRGSRFTLYLPLALEPAADALADAPPPAAPAAQRPQRVLVVDDNRDAADSACMLLGLLGAETSVAYDGAQGLERIGAWRPDVVLLDLGMPGLDGYEIARRVRAGEGGHPDVTLIALTGWGQQQDRQRTRESGFDHHLVKPVDPQALEAVLGSLPRRPRAAERG